MKPKFFISSIAWIIALLLLTLLTQVRSVFAGDILYEDDFTNLDPSWGTAGDILSVKEGKLVLKPALNTTQSVLNQSNVFDDADIQLEVTLSSGDQIVPGGLIFWAKDYSNFYCFCINANGSFKISHFVVDRWLDPVGWTENNAINKGVGQANKLRVVTKGRQATAYINNKEVITINGQPPQGGGCVGISGGSAQDSQNTWEFASLRVIGIAPAVATATASAPAPGAVSAPAPAAVSAPAPAPLRPTRQLALRFHGSNTIGKELVPTLCEDFLKYEGATSVQRKPGAREDELDIEAVLPNQSNQPVIFEIQCHGSSTGFRDLAAGQCDIAMSSRQIRPEEAKQCAAAGLGNMSSPACENVLGLDGIAAIVHRNNPVSALTKQQLSEIFTGKTTDWSEVGGAPGPIYLYAPDENSGTLDTFRSIVLGTRPLSPRTSRFEDSVKLSDAVAGDANGIGFVGKSFARSTKILAISETGGKPMLPTTLTVATADYPLSRRLYLYTPADPQNNWTRKFVEFARPKLEVFSWWTSGGEAAALDTSHVPASRHWCGGRLGRRPWRPSAP
jgi:phosphate binding protein